ncbi:hypothetical protein [Cryptosporangium minutisporangium]|uniref:hypothetical protein n=1 Tax=Cryptosporangium minutisporangium TaxID=113569 RepID=UPI0035E55E93
MPMVGEQQSIAEFMGELDAQTRRLFRMGVEKWKIASNTVVAYFIYQIGLEYEMDPWIIIGLILIVAAPHAAELVIGNGIGPDWMKPDYNDNNDD